MQAAVAPGVCAGRACEARAERLDFSIADAVMDRGQGGFDACSHGQTHACSLVLPPQWKGRSWMAKGKHATALFEVIHTAKRPPQGSPAAKMAAPRSWWKGRPKTDRQEAPAQPGQVNGRENSRANGGENGRANGRGNSEPTRLGLIGAPPSHGRTETAPPPPPEPVWIEPAPAPAPMPAPPYVAPVLSPSTLEAPAMAWYEPPTGQLESSLQDDGFEPVSPQVTRARTTDKPSIARLDGELSFRLSYGGAIAAAMILLLLVAIAYLAGTRSLGVGLDGDADTADPPRRVQSASTTPGGAAAVDSGSVPGSNSAMLAAVTATPAPASDSSVPPPSAAPAVDTTHHLIAPPPAAEALAGGETVRRQIGRWYVIVQSYPDADMATKAREFLARRGIACTVIQGLPRWTLRSWYSVVGCRPFETLHDNAGLDAYLDRLTDLGDYFAGHSSFNRFEPKLYRWRADADAMVNER
jgi:hypothetical protein